MLRDSSSNINAYDKETLNNLSSVFSDVLSALQQCLATASLTIGVRAGARGAAAPPVLKIFGQNAYDSGKSTWDKLETKSGPS